MKEEVNQILTKYFLPCDLCRFLRKSPKQIRLYARVQAFYARISLLCATFLILRADDGWFCAPSHSLRADSVLFCADIPFVRDFPHFTRGFRSFLRGYPFCARLSSFYVQMMAGSARPLTLYALFLFFFARISLLCATFLILRADDGWFC
ncbi:hypothetical protein, partial [Cytobacillus oceanisediminis]|uniref:hypothetical protein n=1 Tax=Cytobacillus oceanisediminis TaxID=665099 RepID=UPI003736CF51